MFFFSYSSMVVVVAFDYMEIVFLSKLFHNGNNE